jgi:molybdenum cofactor cytidylyltransferase
VGTIGGIILAAGNSTRFGTDKRNQLLASGRTMLEATILGAASAVSDLLVVLRATDQHYARELAERIGLEDVRYFCAPDSALGMAHSLANGIVQVRDWQAVMVILGDLPFILPSTYHAVVAAYRQAASGQPIIVPRFHGMQGHPVLFDRCDFDEIALLQGDVGARSVIRSHPERVIDLEIEDPGMLQDIDRREDLPPDASA